MEGPSYFNNKVILGEIMASTSTLSEFKDELDTMIGGQAEYDFDSVIEEEEDEQQNESED